jgi:hypothetical protein
MAMLGAARIPALIFGAIDISLPLIDRSPFPFRPAPVVGGTEQRICQKQINLGKIKKFEDQDSLGGFSFASEES